MILDINGNPVKSDEPKNNNEDIIIGIDLSLRNTGFVVNQGTKVIDSGVIQTKAFKKPKELAEEFYFQEKIEHDLTQIAQIDAHLNHLVVQYSPHLMVIEVPTFSQNQSSAMALGMIRCSLMRQVFSKHIDVVLYRPCDCKRITGNSKKTSKKDIEAVVVKSGYLALMGQPDHVFDAQAAVLYWRSTLNEDDPMYFEIKKNEFKLK